MSSQLFHIQDEATQVTLSLFGKLDVTTVGELNVAVNELSAAVPNRWGTVVVNLQRLELIDSSGVSALVSLYKRAHHNGGQVFVIGACGQPLQVLRILRMDKVFGM